MAYRLLLGESETVLICEQVVFRGTVVEPENLLGCVAVQMERFDGDVGALQGPVQQAPEVLNGRSCEPDRERTEGDSLPRERSPSLRGCCIRPTCQCRRWTSFRCPGGFHSARFRTGRSGSLAPELAEWRGQASPLQSPYSCARWACR